uniref:Uncharacterized protein LOC110200315 isoform X5 n=1 Tax=Phascolarctos cinereus TaxID=38626 RepID=A0A6P5JA94_PHACI|nr:uncharacterized protein LOC110200315 isoform X5 [Phascolarctos cinereus]
MSKESRERGRETPPQPSRSTLLQSPPRWPGSSQLAGLRGVRTTPPSSRSPPSPLRSTPQSSADGRGGGQAGSAGPERRGRKRETVETYFWLAFWPSPWISCCRLAESLSSSLTPEAATRYLHLPSIVNSGHLRTCAQSLQSDTPRRGQKNFPMYSPSSPSPSSPSSSLAAEALSTGWSPVSGQQGEALKPRDQLGETAGRAGSERGPWDLGPPTFPFARPSSSPAHLALLQ